jgi:hypothetical protein
MKDGTLGLIGLLLFSMGGLLFAPMLISQFVKSSAEYRLLELQNQELQQKSIEYQGYQNGVKDSR